jgi:hypothetical protein
MSGTELVALRVTPDLAAALRDTAKQHGISVSELVRGLIQRAVYGGQLGVSEGYLEGRVLGNRLVRTYLQDALAGLPETVEDALAWLQAHPQRGRAPSGE